MEILFVVQQLKYAVMVRNEPSASDERPACRRKGFFVSQNDISLKKIGMNSRATVPMKSKTVIF